MRWCFSLFALLLSIVLGAQTPERIKTDPSWLWAEGTGQAHSTADQAALNGLVLKLSVTEELPLDRRIRTAVWQTYLPDIRENSEMIPLPDGRVMRYIAWKDISTIFESRWRKVRELIQSAEQAERRGELEVVRTYCNWAETYLASLPSGNEDLRKEMNSLWKRVGPGNMAELHIRNIESEVSAIRAAMPIGTPTVSRPVLEPSNNKVSVDEESRKVIRRELIPLDVSSPLSDSKHFIDYEAPALLLTAKSKIPSQVVEPAPLSFRWTVLATAELGRIPAFGLTGIGMRGKWGAYVGSRSNFENNASDYSCTSDGKTSFGYLWATGRTRAAGLSISAGPVYGFSDWMNVYLGGGYGYRTVLWEDSSGHWARVSDVSRSGLLIEAGLVFSIHRFSGSIGISTIRLQEYAAVIGLGWQF